MSESTAAIAEKHGCPLGSLGPSANTLRKGYSHNFSVKERELGKGRGLKRPEKQCEYFF